ncbi:SusC/RagA family TonB-linked outer membrane protein [Chryseolinea lacunae]|nr:TonB-dependent receptor [Chryseolinea lacunae]
MKEVYRSFVKGAFVLLLLLGCMVAYGQRVVTGTIKDPSGAGMPGVNVLLKGTPNGTSTDADGNFSISANDEDVLTISFIGYKSQEIKVGNQSRINVDLQEDVSTLQEVVVVGYGEMKRADISGAQTSVSSEQISKTINTTIEQAIQGRAAGVYITQNTGQPGGGISVNIRGINTINGSNEPLYVIDGVQIQPSTLSYGSNSSSNVLAGINPSDIANIEILQGPSATAIYGSRGTNGVILISTKRGKSGDMKVNYGFMYSLQEKPKNLPTMNLAEFAQMTNEIRQITGGTPPPEFANPSLLGPGTNWQDELFKTAPLSKHQLSLSGGTDKTNFYLSGEHFDQDGVAIGSSFKRNSIRLNVDNQTRKWLKIGTNLSVNQTRETLTATQENTILNALQIAPNIPVKNPDGSWGGADLTNGNIVQFTPLNPVAIANLIQNKQTKYQVLGGLNLDVTLIKGLVFRTSLNGNLGFSRSDYFTPTYRLGNKTNDVASLTSGSSDNNYWNWNQMLQYNTRIEKHDIGVMVSHEAQKSEWQNVSGSKRGFVTNEIPDLNIGNTQGATTSGGHNTWAMESYFARVNYSFNDKYIVQGTIRADGSVNFGPDNKWGYFPSVSAAWRISQEPFMQSASFINELKLRVETGVTGSQGGTSYYGPLSSVSTPWGSGFILQRFPNSSLKWEETATNNIGFNLSILQNRIQLEGDFYIKKTDNVLMTSPLPLYMGSGNEGHIEPPPVNIGSLENRGWAFTLTTVNIDQNGFSWKSNFNVSGFKTEITKFYSDNAFVDRTSWFIGDTGSGNNWTQRAAVGQAPWLFRGYLYDGIFQSVDEINNSAIPTKTNGQRQDVAPGGVWVGDIKYKDLNGDNKIDEKDITNIGNPWPKATFGFTNTFSYKGFDLNILLTASYGNDIYNFLRFSNTNPNNINLGRNLMKETFDYARVEGTGSEAHLTNPGGDIPRIVTPDVNGNGLRFTDKFVEDGSYIRVKNVTLGYSFPKSLIGKQNVIQGLHLAVGAQNLHTFTKYKGYDPEVGAYVGRDSQSNNQSVGVDFGRYPLTPVYTFNVSVDF